MIEIRKARGDDAYEILEFTKKVGAETDNLTFDSKGMPMSVREEAIYLEAMLKSNSGIFLVALEDNKLIATASFVGYTRERIQHRGEVAITVLKSHWGKGIGSKLLEILIDFAKNKAKAQIVSLEVRSDNYRALKLYRKYGFMSIGTFKGFTKINGELIDFELMNLYL